MFILSEDKALHALLKGMTVSDEKQASRQVGVWFGQPDIEIRPQTYPYITIDLIDVREAVERAHRGNIELTYVPDGAPAPEVGKSYTTDYPIPYDITYQITTYARHPRHDRQIIASLLSEKIGSRMHSLHIPEDNTDRSMFLVQTVKRDRTEDNRRLFSNAFTVVVYSELLPSVVRRIPLVDSVVDSVTVTTQELQVPES